MKFACDRCGKMYVLADDKIAAKEDVRLKCRQCGDVIVVKQAGEIVAKSPVTPVPRLPLPEGALPPPAMPPQFKRASGRDAPAAPTDEHEEDEPVDAHSETIPEPMRPFAAGLPRTALPRPPLAAPKGASGAPKRARPAEPPAEAFPETVRVPSELPALETTQEEGDHVAAIEPVRIVLTAENEQPAPEAHPGAGENELASAMGVMDRIWLGASGTAERRRVLLALGVGFVLGTLFGLVF